MKKLLFLLIIFCLLLWLNQKSIVENLDLNDVQNLIELNKVVSNNQTLIKNINDKITGFGNSIETNTKNISNNTKEIKENSSYITNLKKKMQQLSSMNKAQ